MRRSNCGFKDGQGEVAPDLLVRFGPTLLVDIGFDPKLAAGANPDFPLKKLKALVDTGAGDSCIDSGVAMQLGLPVIDQRLCSGIGGATRVNMHLAQIYIPSLKHTLFGSFAGVHLSSGGQWHQALLGRTFLRPFKLSYDGPTGQVVISDP